MAQNSTLATIDALLLLQDEAQERHVNFLCLLSFTDLERYSPKEQEALREYGARAVVSLQQAAQNYLRSRAASGTPADHQSELYRRRADSARRIFIDRFERDPQQIIDNHYDGHSLSGRSEL